MIILSHHRCFSSVGRVGGGQRISIGVGCEYKGIVMHEIFHALGRWHEQSRPDRDAYVTIKYDNIKDGKSTSTLYDENGGHYCLVDPAGVETNFMRLGSELVKTQGVQYDYHSVMHYSGYAFSRNGRPTIEPKDRSVRSSSLGQRVGLSSRDIQHVLTLYCTGIDIMKLAEYCKLTNSYLLQLKRLAGVPGVPGPPAVERVTEEFGVARDRVKEAQLALAATSRNRRATARSARWQPSGLRGAAGVAAQPPAGEAGRPRVGGASMETRVQEKLSSTGAATPRPARWLRGPGPSGLPGAPVLPHVVEPRRLGPGSASANLAKAPPHNRGPATLNNVRLIILNSWSSFNYNFLQQVPESQLV